MPATRYKIWSIGSPVGEGAMQSMHVGVAGLAKCALPAQPYAVVNELICGHLAHALLLPIPPGFIIEHEDKPYHVSLNFNLAGEDLPPVDAASGARRGSSVSLKTTLATYLFGDSIRCLSSSIR
jgi:hypothetical protein